MNLIQLIQTIILIFLFWQGIRVLRDFRRGYAQVRRWWFVPWWRLEESDPMVGSIEIARSEDPIRFWIWTLAQVLAIVVFMAAITTILVANP